MNSTCNETLELFGKKDFANWKGLSPDCTPEHVFEFTGQEKSDDVGPSYWRGEGYETAFFHKLAFQGFENGVTMWSRDSKVLCLTAAFPVVSKPAALLEALGAPAAKLDYYFDVILIEGGLYLYPDRGLALFMSTTYDNVVELEVFSPQTVSEYRASLYYLEQPREFLERE